MKRILLALLLLGGTLAAFSQQKSEIPLTVAETAAILTGQSPKPLVLPMPDGGEVELQWSERLSSFRQTEGIRTFAGRDRTGTRGILTLRGDRITGWLRHGGRSWRVETEESSRLSVCPEASPGDQGCSDETREDRAVQPARRMAAQQGGSRWSEVMNENIVYNNGVLYVYRLALPVAWSAFSSNYFGSDIGKVKEFWAGMETYLNDIYTSELGIFFQVVDDDRLIVTSEEQDTFNSTSLSYVSALGTNAINDLTGEGSYDIGMFISLSSGSLMGIAAMAGAYMKRLKGHAAAIPSYSTIAHEIGHMFGARHTFSHDQSGADGSTFTEPGRGQSIMGYGDMGEFFSIVSISRIRRITVDRLPYLNYPEGKDTIDWYKWRSELNYSNFPRGIQTANRPPVIDTTGLKHYYRIPRDTYFQFRITATDPDGDALSYVAQQADICTDVADSKARFASVKETADPLITFQPRWRYSWGQAKFIQDEYTEPSGTGSCHFWLGAYDGRVPGTDFLESPHAACYDAYETLVEMAEGTPFRLTSTIPNACTAGQRLTLTWGVDTDFFPAGSRVRILLSDDFGSTFKYVLKESAPNNGRCEVILPQATFSTVRFGDTSKSVRPGVIKVEEIGGIAYALSAVSPIDEYNGVQSLTGGFRVADSGIAFAGTPERYVTVNEDEIPPVAEVTATSGGKELEVTYSETRDGNVISRVWEAENEWGTRSAFEQIIVIKDAEPPVVHVESIALDAEELTLTALGETRQLTATVLPADATDPSVSWQSDDEAVCTVNGQGLVTATGDGSATVTATTADGGFTATCAVTVFTLSTGINAAPGKTWNLRVSPRTLLVENASGERVEIFTAQGIRLFERSAARQTERFTMPQGLYLVRVGGHTRRIFVK